MQSVPLVPTPLYGLRAWNVVGEPGAELLKGPQQGGAWPPGGQWVEAVCSQSAVHQAPVKDCGCGLHAWHPTPRHARRIVAGRGEVPGIVEARGAIEVHDDGFRAQRARPFALFLLPGRNARLVNRLAEAYGVQVVDARGADDVLAFCQERGLGLDEAVVAELLGPEGQERRRAARRRQRFEALRFAAAIAVALLLVVIGLQVATDPPGDHVLNGRTGEIHVRH